MPYPKEVVENQCNPNLDGHNETALTNSLLVTEKFKKEHSIVVRDIDNLIEKTQGLEIECDTNLSGHK